jgi:hypothetical protein
MIEKFTQVYIHKLTKKEIRVKRLDCYQILIFDPETGTERRSNRKELLDFRYDKKRSKPHRWQNMLFTSQK